MISFGRKKSKVIRISWSTRCFCLLVASFFNSFYFLFIFLFIGWASRLPMHKTRESNTKWPNSKPPVDMCSSFSQVSCFVALFIHGLRCCISWLFFSRLQNDVLLNATNRLHKYSVVRSFYPSQWLAKRKYRHSQKKMPVTCMPRHSKLEKNKNKKRRESTSRSQSSSRPCCLHWYLESRS